MKRLHDDQQVLKESGINQQELSFAHTDFRALRLNEIEWIKNPDLSSANLTETNLIGAQLNYVNLWSAQLNGANLRVARLNGANLMYAQLNGADFRDAKLHGANLRKAQLHGADFWHAQLHGADFRDAQLHGANLILAQLYGAYLENAQLHGANLRDAELHGADLRRAQLHGANLENAQLHGTNLWSAQLHGANLMFARLYGADLRGAQAQYTSFEAVRFEGLADDDLEELKSDLGPLLLLSEQTRTAIAKQASQDAQVNVKNWKVWHTSKFLDNLQIDRLSQDAKWGLEWWEEIKEGVDAQVATLKGLLRNFAKKDDTDRSPRAAQCRLAVKQLLQGDLGLRNQFIADDQGEAWWEWLSKLNEKGE